MSSAISMPDLNPMPAIQTDGGSKAEILRLFTDVSLDFFGVKDLYRLFRSL
jgi:hypothetical protein